VSGVAEMTTATGSTPWASVDTQIPHLIDTSKPAIS
jgi:hypothetical protein